MPIFSVVSTIILLNVATVSSLLCGSKKETSQERLRQQPSDIAQSNPNTLQSKNAHIFSNVYDKLVWGDAGGGSGLGSDPGLAKPTVSLLKNILMKYNIPSLLDAPCGAVHSSWMKDLIGEMSITETCFVYHGVDVVKSVVDKNIAAFQEHSKYVKFTELDLSLPETQLPNNYKLILSRDALQHLSYSDIAVALRTYCRTNSFYLLIGSYLDNLQNLNVESGDMFKINVRLNPFNFSEPVEVFQESFKKHSGNEKYLLLYNLRDLCKSNKFIAF